MPALFAPAVVVNNVPVGIKPNSFSYNDGFGERNVRVASAGGGSTTNVTTTNIETQKGSCKFMMLTTSENVELIRSWLANFDANVVEVSDIGGFSRTYVQAVVINNVEPALGESGEVEIQFESRRGV